MLKFRRALALAFAVAMVALLVPGAALAGSNALQFDGIDDFVSIPDTNGNFDVGTTFTVEAWVKPAALGASTDFKAVAQAADTEPPFTNGSWVLFLDHPDPSTWGLSVCVPACNAATSGAGSLQAGVWQHLAATYDGTAITIYRNGVLVATTPWSGTVSPTNFILLGRWESAFNGLIDEVRVWNVARTQSQIQANMNVTLLPQAGLVGYWRLDEGFGQTAFDSSGKGNNGRLGTTAGADAQDPLWVASDSPVALDSDGDGKPDTADNCPFVYNPDQQDTDNNGIGDACQLCPESNSPEVCDAKYSATLSADGSPKQPGEPLWVMATFLNNSTHDITTFQPDCVNTTFTVTDGELTLPPTIREKMYGNPTDVVTIPAGATFAVTCNLAEMFDPAVLTSGSGGASATYQVDATYANDIECDAQCQGLGGTPITFFGRIDSATQTITIAGSPAVTRSAQIVFNPSGWLPSWASTPGTVSALISHIDGHPVSDVDPSTIRLNGTVPIIVGSNSIDATGTILTVSFDRMLAVQSLGSVANFVGASDVSSCAGRSSTFATVQGRFKTAANTPNEIFVGNGAVFIAHTSVPVDIKPGAFPNSINLSSNGVVPVAILSTPTFDATKVDPTTITMAGSGVRLKGNGTAMASFQDVNGDGRPDLVVQVSTQALQLTMGDVSALVQGRLLQGFTLPASMGGGTTICGADSIRVVP